MKFDYRKIYFKPNQHMLVIAKRGNFFLGYVPVFDHPNTTFDLTIMYCNCTVVSKMQLENGEVEIHSMNDAEFTYLNCKKDLDDYFALVRIAMKIGETSEMVENGSFNC